MSIPLFQARASRKRIGTGLVLQMVYASCLLAFMSGVGVWAASSVTLTWMDEAGEWHRPWVEEMLETFHDRYPNINVEFMPSPGGQRDAITVQMAAGTAPDVVVGFGTFFRSWAEAGFLLDLRPHIKHDMLQRDVADIPDMMWRTFQVNHGPFAGIQYAIPKAPNISVITVNLDHLDAAGLGKPADWNWYELLAYARKLTRAGGEEVERYGFHLEGLSLSGLLPWIWSNGGDVFDFPNNPTRFRLHEEPAVKALEWVRDLVHVHKVAPPTSGGARNGFVQEKWAMTVDGTAGFRQLSSAEHLRWDVMPKPMGVAGRGNIGGITGQGIYAGTQHPEESWLLLAHITSAKSLMRYTPLTGRQPARISAMKNYTEAYPQVNTVHVINAMVENLGMVPDVTLIEAGRVLPIIDDALQRSVARNELPVKAAVSGIAPMIEAIYRESGFGARNP